MNPQSPGPYLLRLRHSTAALFHKRNNQVNKKERTLPFPMSQGSIGKNTEYDSTSATSDTSHYGRRIKYSLLPLLPEARSIAIAVLFPACHGEESGYISSPAGIGWRD
jgi:hypothetical protein